MKDIIDYIKTHDNFIVTSHVSPDGDNVSSCIAMYLFLKKLGKNVFHLLDDDIPDNLNYLIENRTVYKSQNFPDIDNLNKYTIIAIDCANTARLAIEKKFLNCFVIDIDHHIGNENYGNINYIAEASSSCEVVYDIIMNFRPELLTSDIATALYTGLATDTGNFMYDNTKPKAFAMAGSLIEKGAEKQKIVDTIFRNEDLNYKKFKADLILNHFELKDNYSIMILKRQLLDKYGVDDKNTESLPSLTVEIKGAEIGVLLREKTENITKGSFRSKSKADIRKLAEDLGGGGHSKAAGFTLNMPIDEAVAFVETKVKEYLAKWTE